MKVKMRLRGVPGVAHQSEHLAAFDMVADFYSGAAWLQVRVEGIAAVTDVEDYMIPSDGFHGDGDGARIFAGDIFGDSVFDFGDGSVGYGQGFHAVRSIAFVIERIALEGLFVGINPHPVDGEALGDGGVALHGNQCAAMS